MNVTKMFERIPELGKFCSAPAGMIDRAYLNEPQGRLEQAGNFVKIRAIYVLLFLPCVLLDLIISAILGCASAIMTFLLIDATQARFLVLQQKYATLFGENLYTMLTCYNGLISPRLITFYFNPEKLHTTGVSAGGSYYHTKYARRVLPEDVESLQTIIRNAISKGHKIIPVGAGYSQGKQFIPDGGVKTVVVDMAKFNTIEVNAKKKTATVGAGVRWTDLQATINQHKLALKVMQASNVFSVGGSVGTDIHGWDHRTGSLSNTIVAMDIIDAQGMLQTLTPVDELFHHITGGLGLFGIVVSIKMSLRDNELLFERSTNVSLTDYVGYFRENVLPDEAIRMHLYRLSLDPDCLLRSGVAVSYIKEDETKPLVSPHLWVEEAQGSRLNREMIGLARRFSWLRKLYWQWESKQLLANTSGAQSINEIMRPPIKAMFNPSVSEAEWLQEYFLPGHQLATFLSKLGELLMNNQVVLLNASVRFVKQHQSAPLSYAREGDRFAVVLCFNQSLREAEVIKAKKWLRLSQQLAIAHGGTYYLPYQHVSSPQDFEASYPGAREALAYKMKVDPGQVFSSGFYQKYMAPGLESANPYKTVRKHPEAFDSFLGNYKLPVERSHYINLLQDVMSYNDSPEEIQVEFAKRLSQFDSSASSSSPLSGEQLTNLPQAFFADYKSKRPAGTSRENELRAGTSSPG